MKKNYRYLIIIPVLLIAILIFVLVKKGIKQAARKKTITPELIAGKGYADQYKAMLIALVNYADSTGLNPDIKPESYFKVYDSISRLNKITDESKRAALKSLFIDSANSMMFRLAYGEDLELVYNGAKYHIDTMRVKNMVTTLAEEGDWQQAIDSLEPKTKQYQLLKNSYGQIRALSKAHPQTDTAISAQLTDSRNFAIAKLKDWGLINNALTSSAVSDDAFRNAIIQFQKMTGADTTGTTDKNTLPNLNIPLHKRLLHIKRSLNLYRWCNRLKGTDFVLVNIAATRLKLVSDTIEGINMRAIAGRQKDQTPLFAARFIKVTTYPHWVVPLSIETLEMLPRIQKNITYLEKNNLEVLDNKGNILNPADINWAHYNKNNFPFSIRQKSGCDDALGILKFSLSCPFDIYLHDTDARQLMKNKNRFLSHGCVRIEQPLVLAKYLLEDRLDSATIDSLNQCMKDQSPRDIQVKKKVAIVVYYLTADMDENGQLRFYNDIYGIEKY